MQTQHRHLQSMGTRLDMVFPGLEESHCDDIMKRIMTELARIEAKLSLFRNDSAISVINKTAHAGVVELDSELSSIFQNLIQYHKESEGYFDVTMKPVFDFFQKEGAKGLPVPDHIRSVVGMDGLEVFEHGIKFRRKGMMVDLGGYGKGYAVMKILQILEANGVDCALISFGESLVFGVGTHPYGDSWKISVPVDHASKQIEFKLQNEALSTSGNSLNNQKKFAYSGHIVNPVTFVIRSLDGLVSVKTKDPVRAEVFSTAFFGAGKDRSIPIMKSIPDLSAKWLLQEG